MWTLAALCWSLMSLALLCCHLCTYCSEFRRKCVFCRYTMLRPFRSGLAKTQRQGFSTINFFMYDKCTHSCLCRKGHPHLLRLFCLHTTKDSKSLCYEKPFAFFFTARCFQRSQSLQQQKYHSGSWLCTMYSKDCLSCPGLQKYISNLLFMKRKLFAFFWTWKDTWRSCYGS